VISVLAIAPSGPAREKLEQVLDLTDASVVGWAEDLEAIDEELADEADVVLVDATETPPEELLESLEEAGPLRDARVVVLIDRATAVWVNRAIHTGVAGILPADVNAEQFAKTLEAVASGLVVIHPSGVYTPRSADTDTASGFLESLEALTARERDVLQMLARGLGNKEIAVGLKISEHTVKFHVASILGKLGAGTRTEAVSIALRRGLILI
jgi:NarL family two-component system response regulator YdfI